MRSENEHRQDRLTTRIAFAFGAFSVLFIAAAIALSWRAQIVSGGVQLLGIVIAALGVPTVGARLERLVNGLIAAKQRLDRWWASQRRRLINAWARLRGRRSVVVHVAGASAGASGGGATISVGHPGVDRSTVSDRDWLAFLNDQVDALRSRIHDAEATRDEDRREFDQRLTGQASQLRAEMVSLTQRGWQLVLTGLSMSAIGIVIGMV
jgi:hypothetical protein